MRFRYFDRSFRWVQTTLRATLHEDVAQSTLIILSGEFARLSLGFLGSVFLVRGLGPEGLSVFSVVGAALLVGIAVAEFGLSQGAIRQIASDLTHAPQRAHRTAGALAQLRQGGGLLLAALGVIFSEPLTHILKLPETSGSGLIRIAALGLFATCLGGIPVTILNALHRYRAMVAPQLLKSSLNALLMGILFLSWQLSVPAALWVGVITSVTAAGLGFLLLPPPWRAALREKVGPFSQESRNLITFSKWVWISAIFSLLWSQLDLLLLNRWEAAQTVGLYALALNLASKADILNRSLRTVLLPTVSALSSTEAYLGHVRQSLRRSLILATVLVAALPLAGPFVVFFYGSAFRGSVSVFYLLMAIVIIDLFATPPLLLAYPMNMPRLMAVSEGAGVATLVGAASFLIPGWGMYGAALAKVASRMVTTLVTGTAVAVELRNRRQGS